MTDATDEGVVDDAAHWQALARRLHDLEAWRAAQGEHVAYVEAPAERVHVDEPLRAQVADLARQLEQLEQPAVEQQQLDAAPLELTDEQLELVLDVIGRRLRPELAQQLRGEVAELLQVQAESLGRVDYDLGAGLQELQRVLAEQGKRLDGLRATVAELEDTLREVGDLPRRVNTLGRHLVGVADRVGYKFPQRERDTATGSTPVQRQGQRG